MAEDDLWVFGYGSLIWRPGFVHMERHLATIHGYHRALCVYSHVHRGTPEKPGLVLGLDIGGSCRGIAYRVPAPAAAETIAYLRARELQTLVYREIFVRTRLDDGRLVRALCYAVDRTHVQYAGRLAREELERLVLQGHGFSGANPEYVRNTQEHLVELGIHDATLAWLSDRLAEVAEPARKELAE
jgi:glutathione-specific gamma-glutamylcyclotransferase